jgi:hypothetical protein
MGRGMGFPVGNCLSANKKYSVVAGEHGCKNISKS